MYTAFVHVVILIICANENNRFLIIDEIIRICAKMIADIWFPKKQNVIISALD